MDTETATNTDTPVEELEKLVKAAGYYDGTTTFGSGCGCRPGSVRYITCWFHELSVSKQIRIAQMMLFQRWRFGDAGKREIHTEPEEKQS